MPRADTDPRSTPEVIRDVTTTAQLLFRKELELARLELQEGLRAQMTAVGLAVGAAVLSLFVFAFVGVTAAVALEQVLEPWAAWAIVTGVYLLLVVVALLVARGRARSASMNPEQSKAAIEEDVAWAKQQLRR